MIYINMLHDNTALIMLLSIMCSMSDQRERVMIACACPRETGVPS